MKCLYFSETFKKVVDKQRDISAMQLYRLLHEYSPYTHTSVRLPQCLQSLHLKVPPPCCLLFAHMKVPPPFCVIFYPYYFQLRMQLQDFTQEIGNPNEDLGEKHKLIHVITYYV